MIYSNSDMEVYHQTAQPMIFIDGVEYGDYPSVAWDKVPPEVDEPEEETEVIDEELQPSTSKAIHIGERIYKALAEQLREIIEVQDQCSTTIELPDGEITCRFTFTAFIYCENVSAPDGIWSEVKDVVPVWWELHTYVGPDMVERLHDATFDKLKTFLIH